MNNYSNLKKQNRILRTTVKVLDFFVGIIHYSLKTILTLVLIFCIAGTIVASGIAYYVFNMVDDNSGIELEHLSLNETSIVYSLDEETQLPVEETRLHGSENRIWIDLEEMPQDMLDAAVAIEDKRFWEHHGVDWKRTAGSLVNSFVSIYGSNAGGSTLTQQLIKNLTGEDEVSFDRKIKEIMRALDLEKKYDKDEIIEAYLNTIHLGAGCDGIQAAANKYFDKDAKDLNLAECASIIGITQYPVKYNPLIHEKENKERQEVILYQMLEQGYITQEEYEEAVNYELVFAEQEEFSDTMYVESDYTDMVCTAVVNDLQEELGYTKSYAQRMLYYGGLRIYMAVDNNIQGIVEDYFVDEDNFPKKRGAIQPQASMCIMGYDGRIVGVAGRIGEKTKSQAFNRATQSQRAIGSSMKPIGSYGPGINENVITWSTKIENQPIIVDGKRWPPNYGGGAYGEPVTVQYALMRSLNTVAVRVVDQLGLEKSYDYATNRFGLSLVKSKTINYTQKDGTPASRTVSDVTYSSLALGGFTYGINTLQLAAAFQAFGNGGKYYEPWCYYYVTDAQGNILLEHSSNAVTAIESDTAWVMNNMLRTVVGSGGTGPAAVWSGSWTIFAKTGTSGSSADTYDVTFCGGTPYYVAATWFGFDTPQNLSSSLTSGAIQTWRNVMKNVHSGLSPSKSFEADSSVVRAEYCAASGNLIGAGCPSGGTGFYRSSNVPPVCNGIHEGWTSGMSIVESGAITESSTEPPSLPPSQTPSSDSSDHPSSDNPSSDNSSSGESNPEGNESRSATHRPAE